MNWGTYPDRWSAGAALMTVSSKMESTKPNKELAIRLPGMELRSVSKAILSLLVKPGMHMCLRPSAA
jgi:hypothetical protein